MGDMMMYAVIAGIAAGVFFYMFKKVSGGDYKPIELKNCPLCGKKTAKFVTMGDEYTSYKQAAEAWNSGKVKVK